MGNKIPRGPQGFSRLPKGIVRISKEIVRISKSIPGTITSGPTDFNLGNFEKSLNFKDELKSRTLTKFHEISIRLG